jgi:hypothetical protein
MQYILPLAEFPLQIAVSHGIASQWFPFYSSFSTPQKCEWLAWTSTVLFQTTFTALYLGGMLEPLDIGIYFLGHVLYDTAFLTFYNRDPLMYIHHVVSGGICVAMYFADPSIVAQIAGGAAILERSNILLGIVWLLNRAGYGKTLLVQGVGASALAAYLYLRLFQFPLYLWTMVSPEVLWVMSVFVPMNVIWSWKLVRYYLHISFSKKEGGDRLE